MCEVRDNTDINYIATVSFQVCVASSDYAPYALKTQREIVTTTAKAMTTMTVLTTIKAMTTTTTMVAVTSHQGDGDDGKNAKDEVEVDDDDDDDDGGDD